MKNPDERILKLFATQKDFGTVGPYRTTGGWWVPIYFDSRKAFSEPKKLTAFAEIFIELIREKKIRFDVVVGGATAGMPIGLAVALKLKKPFCYVRKQAKKGGLCNAVEGYYKKGWKAILIDDFIANGTSKKAFIRNMRKDGLKVDTIIVALRRPKKKNYSKIRKLKVKVYDFGSLDDLNEYMAKNNYITKEAFQLMNWYTKYPDTWQNDPKKMEYLKNYKKMKKNSKLGV
ncbi:MAG: hypothetical protein COY66_02795 [Candidatus Kerfeldbacteria bacterium CG_4_10_14_0_8_um_filter_42_10]|uniref:Orotate phosphoribosyltransferase n=1 Tax=Candidatus Kerfeldbacteria bacterium CG_4_10_14_0_8_um_filter_42_10 TaxID=2014248 RepID=A0A2M7RJB0_9BACT|nr:MAG: hypothetical protein COY66_02795 [Candidatus Kerfeldbacteria bacterium CG_4_10_14_0_8_um_filter_42_10]